MNSEHTDSPSDPGQPADREGREREERHSMEEESKKGPQRSETTPAVLDHMDPPVECFEYVKDVLWGNATFEFRKFIGALGHIVAYLAGHADAGPQHRQMVVGTLADRPGQVMNWSDKQIGEAFGQAAGHFKMVRGGVRGEPLINMRILLDLAIQLLMKYLYG